jgi:hypothetical protein
MTLAVWPQLKWHNPASGALTAYEAGQNCGPAAGAGATNAILNSGNPVISHHDFRLKAGNPKDSNGRPMGLATAQTEATISSYGVNAKRFYGEDINIARDALKAGHIVLPAIHYPYINLNYPDLSGDKRFNGEHILCLEGWWQGRYRNTKAFDPLFDGRTKWWGTAPNGPQRAPFRAYRGAMQEFRIIVNGKSTTVLQAFGPGKGVFIVVEQ